MIFNINNIKYIINFQHDINKGICTGKLYYFNNNEKIYVYPSQHNINSICNKKDHYNKDIGRKIVMRSLIITFNKEERQSIWEQYFIQTNKPFKNKKDAKRSSN